MKYLPAAQAFTGCGTSVHFCWSHGQASTPLLGEFAFLIPGYHLNKHIQLLWLLTGWVKGLGAGAFRQLPKELLYRVKGSAVILRLPRLRGGLKENRGFSSSRTVERGRCVCVQTRLGHFLAKWVLLSVTSVCSLLFSVLTPYTLDSTHQALRKY